MHIHVLGVCGTFMAGLARIAVELGHKVTGSDKLFYPPMSTQLESLNIDVTIGYDADVLDLNPDLIVVGNALTRGVPVIERALNERRPWMSGPQWLSNEVLQHRRVLALAGTHGKTTTSSIVAWILEYAGYSPGFLIGGVPGNFGQSSRLGSGDTFVIEADEYDTAFFDKRAKFVHYPATALGINNIEHDHADIYPNVASIQRQFHHWIRQTPSNAQIVVGAGDANVDDTLRMGCWTPVQTAGIGQGDWSVKPVSAEFDRFDVYFHEALQARVEWSSFGAHNAANATVAIALAKAAGVDPSTSAAALNQFKAPARRLQAVAPIANAATYLDFAHHPTAVRRTLEALKARYEKPLIAVVEPRSNTMRAGTHKRDLLNSLTLGESAWVLARPELEWGVEQPDSSGGHEIRYASSVEELAQGLRTVLTGEQVLVIMSNGDSEGLASALRDQINHE